MAAKPNGDCRPRTMAGGGAMSEQAGRGWQIRSTVYFVLAVAAALATPSPDVLTMLMVFLAGVALFEAGFFVYRRWRGGGGR